jgi:hypothetical protein
MADTYAAGGYTFDSDDVGGFHYPYVKLAFGANGTATYASATNPIPVQPIGGAASGASIFRSLDLDESEEEVKASAGTVYGIIFTNTTATTGYLKLYNATAANVTVGTTTPVMTIPLPGNSSDDITGVISFPVGVKFDTAICAAVTTGLADNSTGAPGASEFIVNIFYV